MFKVSVLNHQGKCLFKVTKLYHHYPNSESFLSDVMLLLFFMICFKVQYSLFVLNEVIAVYEFKPCNLTFLDIVISEV